MQKASSVCAYKVFQSFIWSVFITLCEFIIILEHQKHCLTFYVFG